MIRRLLLSTLVLLLSAAAMAQSKVYVTRDISPESLIKIYEALGRKAKGRVAVKVSTGEAGNPNYLQPSLIGPLVKKVDGTIVECNTAYGGRRSSTEEHMRVAEEHGFTKIAKVEIMDAKGEFKIPVRDTTNIKYDLVGTGLKDYDFMINLAHFKGHPMGGLGGVIKNQSIGVASANGKAYIHSAGYQDKVEGVWGHTQNQDGFLESMAAAAQAVADYFGDNILYISVMNNMSVDCDCAGTSAAEPKTRNIGILASTDILAVDQASVDMVYALPDEEAHDLKERIESRKGLRQLSYMKEMGMGNNEYELVKLD